jgi:mono/diheme cytochrome c family protein
MKKYVVLALFVPFIIFVAYEALIFYDNNFRVGRMWETPAVRPHEKELLIMKQGVVPFGGGEAIFRATVGEALKSPLPKDDPSNMELGKILYSTYCAQCHGSYHDGNGTVGQSFHPLPTDLRSAKVQALHEGVLFKEISYGTPNGRQPPLATTIDISDRWRIIAYIKSLGPRK